MQAALFIALLLLTAALPSRASAKTQWAPSGSFSALHTRAVFSSETEVASRPYGREAAKLASAKIEYGYDGRGNRTSESFGGVTRQFLVDASDRLIASREWDGTIEAWKLAPDGSKTESKQWPASTPWLAGPAYFDTPGATSHNLYEYASGIGALTAVKDATTNADVLRYVLDANGQVTSRTHGGRTQNLAWDVDGRLVSATQVPVPGLSSFELSVRYDGLGLRRSATVKQTPPTGPPVDSTQSWLWSGANGEDELAEGTNLTAIVGGHRLGEGVTPFITDALGSVVAQGSTGTASFTAQGVASSGGTLVSSAGFAGLRSEENSSLNYAQQRWHDPVSGTFVSRDSVGASSYLATPSGLGPHSYGNLNSLRFTDPDGRDPNVIPQGGLDPSQRNALWRAVQAQDLHPNVLGTIDPDDDDALTDAYEKYVLNDLLGTRARTETTAFIYANKETSLQWAWRHLGNSSPAQAIKTKTRQYEDAWTGVREGAQELAKGATLNALDSPNTGPFGSRFNQSLADATTVPVGIAVDVARGEAEAMALGGGLKAATAGRTASRAESTASHVGSSRQTPGGRFNPLNPSARTDNCVAGVCALLRNKLERRGFDPLSADEIERLFGWAGRDRKFTEAGAMEYMNRALAELEQRVGNPVPFEQRGSRSPAAGHYVIFAGKKGAREHVVYGRILPNGERFLFDPQLGKQVTWSELVNKYGGALARPIEHLE